MLRIYDFVVCIKITLILILGSLTALGPFSIDMYLPGFSEIAKDLHTTVAKVSMSFSSYFIGISAGQLLYGPLLDRFGRKKPLFIGLLLYILASLACIYVTDIDNFIVLRFIQAIGSCAATVASVAMVHDLFPVKDIPKVFSLLMLVLGLSPMLAPTIGGYVTEDYGWHMVFFILMCMGIAILVAAQIGLPNSYKPDVSISLKPKPIISNFLKVLKEPQFYTYAFTGSIAFSGLFTYVAASPTIFMDIYLVDAKTYGWIFALMSVSFIGSSQLNSVLLKKYSSEQMIFVAFIKNAGSASALMGAIQLGLGALASFAVGIFVKDSVTPMVAIMTVTTIIAFIVLNIGKRFIKQKFDISADDSIIAH